MVDFNFEFHLGVFDDNIPQSCIPNLQRRVCFRKAVPQVAGVMKQYYKLVYNKRVIGEKNTLFVANTFI